LKTRTNIEVNNVQKMLTVVFRFVEIADSFPLQILTRGVNSNISPGKVFE